MDPPDLPKGEEPRPEDVIFCYSSKSMMCAVPPIPRFGRLMIAMFLCVLLRGLPMSAADWHIVRTPTHAVIITSDGETLWICGVDETVAKSTDQGRYWEIKSTQSDGPVLTLIRFGEGGFGYSTGTRGTILVTRDGGENWSILKAAEETIVDAA